MDEVGLTSQIACSYLAAYTMISKFYESRFQLRMKEDSVFFCYGENMSY